MRQQRTAPLSAAEVAALVAACDVIIADAKADQDPVTMSRLPHLQSARRKLAAAAGWSEESPS